MDSPLGSLRSVTLKGFPGVAAGPRGTETLVFLHGAWDSHRCFEKLVGWFGTKGLAACAYSRRGRLGLGGVRGVSMEDYLDDTRAVLDGLGGQPILVGHSMGGLIAQVLAAEGRCRAAVLLEPGPPKGVPVIPRPKTWPMFLKLAPRVLSGAPFLPSLSDAKVAFLNRTAAATEEIYGRFIPESGRAFRQVLFGYPVATKQVSCPILCVTGLDCPSITPSMVRKTAAVYGADLAELPGHSHWMMEEPGWEQIAARLYQWIGRTALETGARTSVPHGS